MAHLNRIFFKSTPVLRWGEITAYCSRRYSASKRTAKSMSVKHTRISDSWESQYVNEATYPLPVYRKNNDEESKNKFGRGSEFYPKIDPEILQKIKQIAGISVTAYSIGWCKVDLVNKEVLEFGSMVLPPRKDRRSFDEDNIYEILACTTNMLPVADLYIMEQYKLDYRNKAFTVLEVQLLSMLTAILNKHGQHNWHGRKVFLQKSAVIDYLYELNMRGERISSGQKLQRMLNESVSSEIKNLTSSVDADFGNIKLKLQVDFLKLIFTSRPLKRDAVAVAFFLSLSFIELNLSEKALRKNVNSTALTP